MKTKFYHPHTVIKDIKNLDATWLKKQLADKPFDAQYIYLEALRQIGQGENKAVTDAIASLLKTSAGNVRIGALLDRSSLAQDEDNAIDTVSIKSKKSKNAAKTSSLLSGIVDVNSKKSTKKKKKSKTIKVDSDSEENFLEIDMISVDDQDASIDTEREVALVEELQPLRATTASIIATIDDEEEEEEFVSESVVQAPILQTEEPAFEMEPVVARYASPSEMVKIKHSPFTTWLQELPRLNQSDDPTKDPNSSNQPISEPLAKLLAAQGYKADAIKMYNELMLKYPEKSSFFADQIKNLK